MQCSKCGGSNTVETGCSRRGFRRYGGILNPCTEPIACRNSGYHKHYVCSAIQVIGDTRVIACGHKWTK